MFKQNKVMLAVVRRTAATALRIYIDENLYAYVRMLHVCGGYQG